MPVAIDSANTNTQNDSANVLTGSITTDQANEVIVIAASTQDPAGASIMRVASITDTAGLIWRQRVGISASGVVGPYVEYWWAASSSKLTSDSFSVFFSGTAHVAIQQFAIKGLANISSPFDPNPSLPGAVALPSSIGASAPLSTSDGTTIGLMMYGGGGFGLPTCSSPFTQIGSIEGVHLNVGAAYILSGGNQFNSLQGVANANGGVAMAILTDAMFAPGPLRNFPTTAGF